MNKAFIATTIALLTLASTPVWAGDFRVTLLGTGTPTPRAERFTQSTLIEAVSRHCSSISGVASPSGCGKRASACPA